MTTAYEGGYVYAPKTGIHKNIIVLDFKSLYPSIIITHNIDKSTLNCKHKECKKNSDPQFKRYFCTKREGMIPERLKKLLKKRSEIKKKLKSKKLSKAERDRLEKKQKQLKLAANITYGYFGYPNSPYYDINIAESIASFGRYYIKSVIERAKKEGFEIIYGDTDSIFIQGNQKKAKEFLKKINKWLPGIIELEWEGVFKRGLFVTKKSGEGAKKKYALMDSKDKLLIRGFEVRRSDWCELAKSTQEQILKLILSEKNKQAIKYAKDVVSNIENGKFKLNDMIISVQLTKPISKYKSIGPHVATAKKMVELGNDVREGMTVKFIITNKTGSISQKAEPYSTVKKSEVDTEYYINNQIIPAAIRVLSILNVTEKDLRK